MNSTSACLGKAGLQQFAALRNLAIDAVTERFYRDHASIYAQFGERGRAACREDLGFHLEFLRPVLEFGLVAPMVDYLRWLGGVLATREVPDEHLAQSLDWLSEFFAAKMAPPDADIVVAALRAVRSAYQNKDDSPPDMYAKLPPAWEECTAFEATLLAGDRRAAGAIVEDSLARSRGLVDIEMHLIQPALYRIGQKWQANQVSVAQEHLATSIAQSVMVQGMLRSTPAAPNGKKVLLACVEGNHHCIGLQMLADAFDLAGWSVNYLGANVPTVSLVGHADAWNADLLGLSVSFAQQLPVVKDVMARLRKALGERSPPVMIGGLAINNFEALAGSVGAQAWSPDSAAAVVSAARLTDTP